MAGPRPVLYNGVGQSQGIWDTSTSAEVPVGTRGMLDDGRVFYYARFSSSTALVAGTPVQAELISVDFDDLATATTAAGETTLNVTPVGSATYAADDLAGGYAIVNSGSTGFGYTYKIRSNPATSAATAFDLTLFDPINEALDATATVTVMKNPWMDVVQVVGTNQALHVVGVSPLDVADASSTSVYLWVQTWGVSGIEHDETTATGSLLVAGTTAGQAEAQDAVAEQVIAVNLFTGVAGDVGPAFLTIAP